MKRRNKYWANKNPAIGGEGICGFCLMKTNGIIIIGKRKVCGDCASERLWPQKELEDEKHNRK